MKIIGFAQLYNEESKGNLRNWIKSMSFCDYVYIYDQNSTDSSKELYKQQDNFVVVESPVNDFKSEIKCNGDTILSRNEGRDSIERLLTLCDQHGCGSIDLRHFNLWRSDIYYRIDNQYDYLDRVGVRAFWKNNGQLKFPTTDGLHQLQYPNFLGGKVARLEDIFLIHKGFSTDSQIINRYHLYKSRGQSGWSLERLIDENTLAVNILHKSVYPTWFKFNDLENPIDKEKIVDLL